MLDTAHRFCTLSEALGSEQSAWSKDRTLNYRAILAAMGASGPADQLAQAIVRTASELKETRFFTLSAISGPVRLGLSAGLLQSGDTAASFLQAFEAAQHEFRQVGLRRAKAYEAVTVLVHRSLRDRAPVTSEDAMRLKGIYEALKTHHWWLTGPEDLPACALLASRDGSPAQLGDETEAIYQALRESGHFGGETLQTAAMFLVLCHTSPA
ncbi:MAG: DUF4003 family protein, partial [Myxococcota bacterium]|nr:DUF4003 family protein [Myxococcota bacterium]